MITKLAGIVNWRTTVTGVLESVMSLLTILAALPYELGEIAVLLPPEYKAKVVAIGAFSTFALRVLNRAYTKDSQVSGNGTATDPVRVNVGIPVSVELKRKEVR